MANNNNEGVDNSLDSSKDSGLDKSFVGKFVSGLLNNTPLSKWFGKESPPKSVVRRRDDDEDEDASYVFQPPVKRAKLPSNTEHNNYSAHLFEAPVTVHNASNNVNNVSSKVFGKFPEPVAGPSGIKSRKLFEAHNSTASTNTVSGSFENSDIINGENDSDSEESTSGYSSVPRLANKDKTIENTKSVSKSETYEKIPPKARSLFTSTTDPGHSRSLFSERSPQMNTSLSSRRPTFNASTFGSPNFVDKTLSTKKILNSPFYNGHTIYGGASAYGRRLGRSAEDLNSSTRASVQIKPTNEKMTNDNTTLSKTARRILSTLEQYSTPISDAKKIPVTPKKEGILSKYIGASPYSLRERTRPSNKELQVPSIPELLQMKQKEKLQNSTVSVRQIATTSKSTLNKEEYKLRTEEDNKQKYSNKMKNSGASTRRNPQPVEPVSEVKLPKVSLPITTLPKFDFVMMPPQNSSETNKNNTETKQSQVSTESKSTVSEKKEVEKKPVENGKTVFTFSEPLIISKDLKAVSAINCFKFSEPLCKKQCLDAGVNFKSTETNTPLASFKMKNNGENVKPTAGQLMTGSVMDVLRKKDDVSSVVKDKSKSDATWECQTCLVKNDMSAEKCIACHEYKTQPESKSTKGFGDQFKLSSDKWECGSCMVRNNNSDQNCVACGTAKPDNKSSSKAAAQDKTWKCTNCLSGNKDGTDKCTSCGVAKSKPVFAGFGDKFKPSNDTWECNACMIRNKKELDKCEACQTPKASSKPVQKSVGFGFKPPSDTWECPTCMIRNKNDMTKCEACQTLKPGNKSAPSATAATPTFTFGIPISDWQCKSCLVKNKKDSQKCASCSAPKEKKEGFGEMFKIKEGEWECTSCLVRNKAGVDVCTCCGVSKPGSTNEKLTEIGKKEEKKPVISFNFGIDKGGPVFKFGIPPAKSETKESAAVTSTPSTLFSTSTTNSASTPSVVLTSTPAVTLAPASTPAPTFVFGDAAKSTAVTTGSFSFGIGTQEKVAPVKTITSTSENVTSTVGSNPLLKANEKLPEKAVPAPVGFKFGLDTSNNNLAQKPVSSESSTSKTEAPVVFSSSFEPVKPTIPTPTFQFKPTAINGDINKPKELPFSSKPAESSNPFTAKPAENNLFSKPSETTNPFTSKPAESGNLFTSKPADSAGLFQSKPADGGNLFSNKPAESGNIFSNKPAESSNLFSTKPTDSNNIFSNKPTDGNNLFSNKPTEGSNLFANKSAETTNLFSNKPAESGNLFTSKPSESGNLFGSKPAESGNLFGTKPAEGSNLFSNKPAENSGGLFASKPAETSMFASKPAESNNLFSNTSLTPAFKFNVKPTESATSTTSTVSQPAEVNNPPPVFKFGSDSSQPVIPMKKPFGESTDSNVSNGFGAVPKIPAFGTPQPQPFGGSTENKPFAFGGNDSTPKNTGFSFGQPQQPEKPPVFNFGGGASSMPSSGFNFSSPPANTGFNFGGPGKIESQPFSTPPTNVFGSGAPGAKNGSFNFGTNSNNNNQKAIFTFGASQTNQQPSFPTQNQSGFNFGSVAAPPTIPTGGFNFSGAPPSFNFSDGTQSTAPPQRKFKKALRRTHR